MANMNSLLIVRIIWCGWKQNLPY